MSIWNGFLGSTAGVESFEKLLTELEHYKEPQHYTDKVEHIDDIEIKKISTYLLEN